MKRSVVIGLFLLLALAACHQAKDPEPVEGCEGPTYQLQSIDWVKKSVL